LKSLTTSLSLLTVAAGACLAWAVAAGTAGAEGSPGVTALRGVVAHAPSNGVALFVDGARRDTTAGADGSFTFTVELPAPTYVDLEFDFRKGHRLTVFLVPGQPLGLQCDASDVFGSARFTGSAAAENAGLARLQVRYDRIDYEGLFRLGPEAFLLALRQQQEALEADLADYARSQPGLGAGFLRFERARISYFGALLRVMRLGLSGDWQQYASRVDLNDATLLPIDTYSRFLSLYTKAKATERLKSDLALKTSSNQVTEARYAVAVETYSDPAVRSAQLHEILKNQFVEGDDGPFGCKGIEAVMKRFDRDCTDRALREDIDKRYRDCLANRNAPVIRPYKTVGATSLDAHIFPAAGAAPGERRPAYLTFHGGGWAAGMPEWGYAACRRLSARGLVAISFEYRLRWRHGTTPLESVADAKSALRWVRRHAVELGVDPERIVVSGFSAGSHLAAATGIVLGFDEPGEDTSVSAVPQAMVLASAAVDVADPGWFSECLAGRAEAVALSPAQQIRPGLPPAIVFHGRKDELGAFAQVEAFCQGLRAAGNRCELHAFPGGHFREAAEWQVIDEKTDTFLASLGLLPALAVSPPAQVLPQKN
jgi:acetyl esterase/lipase